MNKLESSYALQLEARKIAGEILAWRYEAVRFRLADNTSYTPDFMVILENRELEFHETKGWMREDAAVKIKVAAEMYPFFKFILCTKDKMGWHFREY